MSGQFFIHKARYPIYLSSVVDQDQIFYSQHQYRLIDVECMNETRKKV